MIRDSDPADMTRRRVLMGGYAGLAAAAPLVAANRASTPGPSSLPGPVIAVRDHGVKADGVTDDHGALQRVFDDVLPAAGGVVLFPAGTCVCGGRVVNRGKPVVLAGSGRGATQVLFTGESPETVGFLFDQQRYPNTVQVRDLSLVTNRQETGDALTVAYTPEDCMSMRVAERVVLQNLNIVGRDIAKHGFGNGVVLRHVNSPFLFNVSVSGRQPAAGMENRTHTQSCFRLVAGDIGESMPVQACLMRCSGYNARHGVNLVGAHEGLVVTAGNFVECAVGVSQVCGPDEGLFPEREPLPDGGTRPGVWVSDTHCNVFVAGVYLQSVVQGFIKDCLIYKAPDAAGDCAGVHLSRCADIKIHHTMFVSHTRRGRFVGVRAGNGTTRCHISGNTFEWTDESIRLDPGTTGVHAWDNVSQGGLQGVVIDKGEGNRFRELGRSTWHDAEHA